MDERRRVLKWRIYWWCFGLTAAAQLGLFFSFWLSHELVFSMIFWNLRFQELLSILVASALIGFFTAETLGALVGLPLNVSPQLAHAIGQESAQFIEKLLLPLTYAFLLVMYYHAFITKIFEANPR